MGESRIYKSGWDAPNPEVDDRVLFVIFAKENDGDERKLVNRCTDQNCCKWTDNVFWVLNFVTAVTSRPNA